MNTWEAILIILASLALFIVTYICINREETRLENQQEEASHEELDHLHRLIESFNTDIHQDVNEKIMNIKKKAAESKKTIQARHDKVARFLDPGRSSTPGTTGVTIQKDDINNNPLFESKMNSMLRQLGDQFDTIKFRVNNLEDNVSSYKAIKKLHNDEIHEVTSQVKNTHKALEKQRNAAVAGSFYVKGMNNATKEKLIKPKKADHAEVKKHILAHNAEMSKMTPHEKREEHMRRLYKSKTSGRNLQSKVSEAHKKAREATYIKVTCANDLTMGEDIVEKACNYGNAESCPPWFYNEYNPKLGCNEEQFFEATPDEEMSKGLRRAYNNSCVRYKVKQLVAQEGNAGNTCVVTNIRGNCPKDGEKIHAKVMGNIAKKIPSMKAA